MQSSKSFPFAHTPAACWPMFDPLAHFYAHHMVFVFTINCCMDFVSMVRVPKTAEKM